MRLELRDTETCRYDLFALGEVMLRLDPGESRIRTARSFRVWEGGGEYNVARGLRRCFGLRTGLVSALVDNEIGRLLEDLLLQGGVDISRVAWFPDDGIRGRVRNGLNFTERGYGARGAIGVSDRSRSAASQLGPDDVDWDELFGVQGVRWFHTGGIYAALSEQTPSVIEAATAAARRHGTVVSYDLNYRPSLWSSSGGLARAQEVNCHLATLVDVMLGNEEDFTRCLGVEVAGVEVTGTELDSAAFRSMIGQVVDAYPNLKVVATTLRGVHSATRNDWGAVAWADGSFAEARPWLSLEILDRIGGGDSFASGFIYGLLSGRPLGEAVELGTAHGVLAMTTPGDTSMASLTEVEHLAARGNARVVR
ncbi:MAG: PfkB family carbohydrate kinase [Acidimicrobiales bacterium]